jgi:hypothetical protein
MTVENAASAFRQLRPAGEKNTQTIACTQIRDATPPAHRATAMTGGELGYSKKNIAP